MSYKVTLPYLRSRDDDVPYPDLDLLIDRIHSQCHVNIRRMLDLCVPYFCVHFFTHNLPGHFHSKPNPLFCLLLD